MRRRKKNKKIPNTAAGKHRAEKGVPASALTTGDPREETPVWGLTILDLEGPFGWGGLGRSTLETALQKLQEFERLSWKEIEQMSRNTRRKGGAMHHSMPVEILERDARDRLDAIGMGQLDELFSFHVGSKKRVWGLREGAKYSLLWWDPGHLVYKSKGV